MPGFDAERQCYVGRVVFDGAALAGKTTNLKKIAELVPANRRTEMITPGSLRGRTMFFDWLEIDGPKSASPTALKFQLITVPGQVERNHRRRPLVAMADAVVFVFDCSPDGAPASFDAWRRLRRVLKTRPRPVPVVIQANKQDLEGAQTPAQIASALGVDPAFVLPATSSSGAGVQRTIATALKLANAAVREAIAAGALDRIDSTNSDADALFFAMLEREEQGEIDED